MRDFSKLKSIKNEIKIFIFTIEGEMYEATGKLSVLQFAQSIDESNQRCPCGVAQKLPGSHSDTDGVKRDPVSYHSTAWETLTLNQVISHLFVNISSDTFANLFYYYSICIDDKGGDNIPLQIHALSLKHFVMG